MLMSEQPIRIAQIMGCMNSGGVESFVMNYYRNIDRKKIQFDFIVDSNSEIPQREEIEKLGGKIITISSHLNFIKYIKELRTIFRENKYCIVHSHLNSLSIVPLYCAWKEKIPNRIAHSHSTTNSKEFLKNFVKIFFKQFSKLFATNYFACSNYAARWLFGNRIVDAGMVEIIPNAIDVDKFKFDKNMRNKIRNELGLENQYIIGHVGRFCKQKNHEFLINEFFEISKKNKNIKLLLIGEGSDESKIKNIVINLGIENRVIFLGVKKNVNDYMQAMDLFVFPSLYEGFGIAVIEAECSGLPCIVSDHLPKEVNINDNVVFLNLKSKKNWENEIENKMKQKCDRNIDLNSFIESGYSIKNECSRLQKIYEKILK